MELAQGLTEHTLQNHNLVSEKRTDDTDSSQQEEGGEPEEYEWIPKTELLCCRGSTDVENGSLGSRQQTGPPVAAGSLAGHGPPPRPFGGLCHLKPFLSSNIHRTVLNWRDQPKRKQLAKGVKE